ncbi:MAG: metal ABC transporter permease [Solirubrobacteraceae bacterium]
MNAPPFVENALLAGSLIAIASGLVGYFVVLRSQVFAGDALSHVAFTGAIAAAVIGIDVRLGLFAGTLAVAVAFARLGGRAEVDDVTIGTTFTWVLGLGVLLLALAAAGAAGSNGTLAARELFGGIFSLSDGDTAVGALVALVVIAALLTIARPLLFATVDPLVAGSQGVPVRRLGLVFLVLFAVDAAEATQAVGALLLLGLVAAPAGAAHRLTGDPYRGMLVAGLLALVSLWAGVILSYRIPGLPPSSAIIGVASAIYASSFLAGGRRARRPLVQRSGSPLWVGRAVGVIWCRTVSVCVLVARGRTPGGARRAQTLPDTKGIPERCTSARGRAGSARSASHRYGRRRCRWCTTRRGGRSRRRRRRCRRPGRSSGARRP